MRKELKCKLIFPLGNLQVPLYYFEMSASDIPASFCFFKL